ncbi:arginase family protein [archaeon]|nr:arginase family protein [archaeon]
MKIVKIPYSQGSLNKNQGSELAPDTILSALKEVWLNESGSSFMLDIKEIKLDNNNIKNNFNLVFGQAKEDGIFLGGDHSITYPLFKAFAERYKNPGLIVFDAHPDTMPSSLTHEDFLYNILKDKLIKPENIILVGIRSSSPEEERFIQENKIRAFTMKKIYNNLSNSCDIIMETLRGCEAFYISIDIDCLDPAFAPGTGYVEPGGLTTRELLYFLQRLKLLKNLKSADIVEVDPTKDINNITVKTAAKILGELL